MNTHPKSRLTTRQSRLTSTGVSRAPGTSGSSPRFSVILCTYNRCKFVLTALASLRRQTLPYNEFEVIVIDNGSTDGTLAAVRSYVRAGMQQNRRTQESWRVQCLTEPQNGLAYARNTGLLAASGEIAVFLDDDVIADPRLLEYLEYAYTETGAGAMGVHIEIRWEARRPHWLSDELLYALGYFAPASERCILPETCVFGSSSFSVKIEALRAIGYFSPFLSKRMSLPASTEVTDLCRRLRQEGYALWYEPGAIVSHRAPLARLHRPFFVGRAYWQGRSEVLMHYRHTVQHSNIAMLRESFRDLRRVLFLSLLHRPLLRLASRSTNEQLLAAMEQARNWGRLRQRLSFLEHAPPELTSPSVLFVRSPEPDATADLLVQALYAQDVRCTPGTPDIPLAWLWQHRAYHGKPIGILHFYRPGALHLSYRQRQRLWFRLWLAQQWGIRLVTTDGGGWWQSFRGLRFLTRRLLERKLFYCSQAIMSYTRQPNKLYPDKRLRRQVRCLPHPGFRGSYPPPLTRYTARAQLGIPPTTDFVYLCLAPLHTERELVYLLTSFRELTSGKLRTQAARTREEFEIHMVLIGAPCDKQVTGRVLKLAAVNPAISLHLTTARALRQEDFPLYIGAADALVMPHFALRTAGLLETAMLALSYERSVVAPDLARFRGMLPPRASVLYEAGSREALARALLSAQHLTSHHSEHEAMRLDAQTSWEQYAHRLVKIYRELLSN